MRTTIDHAGRIALGQELQTQLGLKPGDEVVLESHGGEVVIRAAQPTGLCQEGNVLVHRGVCAESDEDGFERIRAERIIELSRGLAQ